MLESSRLWRDAATTFAAASALTLAGCALLAPTSPSAVVVGAAAKPAVEPAPAQKVVKNAASDDPRLRREEARAHLAQAETDVQRARARRTLWSRAWEALVSARAALAADDPANAIALARTASEFAQLGLEQLAYPELRPDAKGSPT